MKVTKIQLEFDLFLMPWLVSCFREAGEYEFADKLDFFIESKSKIAVDGGGRWGTEPHVKFRKVEVESWDLE